MESNYYKVWVNIKKDNIRDNIKTFRELLAPSTQLWAVVKSNAYGHDLSVFSKLADWYGVDGFCVDSVVEGLKLREAGIIKPILVLGYIHPDFFPKAQEQKLTLTVSNIDSLSALARSSVRPEFHLKIDTGMSRQGFFIEDLPKVIDVIKNSDLKIKGIYSHFASAKDINYPTFSEAQFSKFKEALNFLKKAGIDVDQKGFKKHIAATGGTLINKKYHLDLVRVGIGLYGLWPSKELEMCLADQIKLKPVLSWHSVISEIKELKPGDYVGYDLTEKIKEKTRAAIIPIGYWHGIPWLVSSRGEVIISGKRTRILGRVCMDITVVDVTHVNCGVGDEVEFIPVELAQKAGLSHYEVITRINPLTYRNVV